MPDNNKTKEKILTVTEALILNDGIEKVSIRSIAKQASVNIASINYYFSSKRDLLAEILKRKLDNLKGDLLSSLVDTKKFETQNPPEFIISLFDCFYKEKETYFGHYKIILDPDVQNSSRLEDCEKELYFPIGQELLLKNLNHFFPKMEKAETKRISFHIWGIIHHSLFLMSQPLYQTNGNSEDFSLNFVKTSLRQTSLAILKEL
ncbi:MAG: hypothetical protein CME68_05845 [Halobacteriovoraceae bacterium]|nr:hypothetical protein [Halobacteriovoraceae bacterium]